MSQLIKGVAGETVSVMELAKYSVAKQYLPANTQFATVATQVMANGPVTSLSSSRVVVGVGIGERPDIKSWNELSGEKHIGYLYHDGTTLTMKTPEQTIVTMTASDVLDYGEFETMNWITTAQGTFVFGQFVNLYGDGIEQSSLRTDVHSNDAFFKELVALGIASGDDLESRQKSRKVTFIVFIILFVVGTAAIFLL